MLADKARDSNKSRDKIAATEVVVVTRSKRNRKVRISHDSDIDKHRSQIERCFNRLKCFSRFATRYDRRIVHFTGFVHLATSMIWLR